MKPTPGSTGNNPPKAPDQAGYRPVRQQLGDPIVPREQVPAPRPMGLTMQPPPRRGLPIEFDDADDDTTDDVNSDEADLSGTDDPSSAESSRTHDDADPSNDDPPANRDTAQGEDETTNKSADQADTGNPATPTEELADQSSGHHLPEPPSTGGPIPAAVTDQRPGGTPAPLRTGGPSEDAARPGTAAPAPEQGAADGPNPYARPPGGADEQPRPRANSDDPNRIAAGELVEKLNQPPAPKAERGWRAVLNLAPSERERAERADLDMLRRTFDRPITVMVANPKGGVGKTPLALLLAASFGTARGGGVVAWDNNELRGTMPDRSVSEHRRNVRDLLGSSTTLRSNGAGFTDVAQFLNHQTAGTFHTLGSAQESGHAISRADFETVHEILSRFFQILVVDTGNNEAAPNWLAAAATADCLVVPTKWRKDSLIPAARMLESLQDVNPSLLDRTLVVATNGPAEEQRESRRTAAKWFGSRHSVLEIPTDPHIAEGDILFYDKLQPGTQRAALAVAAAMTKKIL